MTGLKHWATWLVFVACLAGAGVAQEQPKKDDIPDAPSATRPPQTFPTVPPAEPPLPESQPAAPQAAPGTSSSSSGEQPGNAAEQPPDELSPAPPFSVKTVPEGGTLPQAEKTQDDLYRIVRNVNQVLIPVTVKDDSGRMVNGLLPKDFTVFENGVKQELNFFTSDPFALSVAVVLDFGMPDTAVQKVNKTFAALEGAFSQFDEVSVYTYSNTVGKAMDFAAAGKKLTAVLNELKTPRGDNNGPPVVSGPFGPQGPTVNGAPIDPSVPTVMTPTRESHVLNDAVLQAALDLNKRSRARRKIIFIVSDGHEVGSKSSYSDVLKVLLSNNIMVYGIGMEGAAIPGYGRLQRLHLPRFGTGDILPKYANATGGEVYLEFSQDAVETAYARAIGDARNQYTLGYITRATPSSTYRQIEVRVANHGPSCHSAYRPCVDVTAKDGYYPMPISR